MVKTDTHGKPVRDKNNRVVPVVSYPYAEDGLDIWYALQSWFGEYLSLYYNDSKKVGLWDRLGLSPAFQWPSTIQTVSENI
jgi:hypothetical protein